MPVRNAVIRRGIEVEHGPARTGWDSPVLLQ